MGGIGIILGIVLGLLTTFISQSAMNAKIASIMEGYNDNIKYSTHISLWVLFLLFPCCTDRGKHTEVFDLLADRERKGIINHCK